MIDENGDAHHCLGKVYKSEIHTIKRLLNSLLDKYGDGKQLLNDDEEIVLWCRNKQQNKIILNSYGTTGKTVAAPVKNEKQWRTRLDEVAYRTTELQDGISCNVAYIKNETQLPWIRYTYVKD